MSLILDALRKSEHQRQRHTGPGLAVIPEAQASRGPATWVLALGGLLVLNVVVLAAVLLSGSPAPAPGPAPAPASSPVSSAPLAADPAPRPPPSSAVAAPRAMPVELPARPPRSEVRPLTTEVAAPTTATVTPSAPTAMQGAAEPVAPPPTRSEAAPARQQSTDDARLPRFADLVVLGQLNVPHMHIDIHVFSTTPADRFVFINMRRYNEGQSTQEGPRVERITRDGVVMEHQGQRFFLSRD
jgi:general secretion pathway protein B